MRKNVLELLEQLDQIVYDGPYNLREVKQLAINNHKAFLNSMGLSEIEVHDHNIGIDMRDRNEYAAAIHVHAMWSDTPEGCNAWERIYRDLNSLGREVKLKTPPCVAHAKERTLQDEIIEQLGAIKDEDTYNRAVHHAERRPLHPDKPAGEFDKITPSFALTLAFNWWQAMEADKEEGIPPIYWPQVWTQLLEEHHFKSSSPLPPPPPVI